jgi:hypothetical protein
MSAPPIPKGLCPPAQGCEARATLGDDDKKIANPNGVGAWGHGKDGRNPVGVGNSRAMFSQGSLALLRQKHFGGQATLGFEAESLWDSPLLLLNPLTSATTD